MLMVWVWAIPLAATQGKMVNYWMQKCDPALMDAEWDNQEANDERNICRTERRWRALYLALDIQNASINRTIPGPALTRWLTMLCSFRVHECIPTQRASSRLTAVHEASAGLAALVWLHIDTHTHTDTQIRSSRDGALRVHGTIWVSTLTKWKESPVRPVCCFVPCGPDSPKLGVVAKSST